MREGLVDILRCPVDKAELALAALARDGDDVTEGTLTCKDCGFVYPIEQGIPNLLPPEFHVDEVRDRGDAA